MSVPVIHETEVEELNLPGRRLRWLVNDQLLGSKNTSVCLIRVAPGEIVRPAHSHPQGEEVIHIITGEGRVMVEGEVSPVRAGSTVLFPQGKVHMLRNDSAEEMKVICFFAPGTGLDNYRMYEDVGWPE